MQKSQVELNVVSPVGFYSACLLHNSVILLWMVLSMCLGGKDPKGPVFIPLLPAAHFKCIHA